MRANQAHLDSLRRAGHRFKYDPVWIRGDGEELPSLYRSALQRVGMRPDTPADFLCSCPPYWNLEKYDAGPKDLSMLPSYPAFLAKYRRVVAAASSLLRDGHFAVFVVGQGAATSRPQVAPYVDPRPGLRGPGRAPPQIHAPRLQP